VIGGSPHAGSLPVKVPAAHPLTCCDAFSAPSGVSGPLVDLGPLAQEIAELGSTVFYFGWHTLGLSADSVADLSCVGPFVAARAAELGADPDNVIVVGHSMGAETGSMLAFSSFDLAPSPIAPKPARHRARRRSWASAGPTAWSADPSMTTPPDTGPGPIPVNIFENTMPTKKSCPA
jgi:hypothetical protein